MNQSINKSPENKSNLCENFKKHINQLTGRHTGKHTHNRCVRPLEFKKKINP